MNLMKKPRILQDYRQAIAVFDPLGKLPREAQIELAEEIGAALQRHHLGNLLDIYDEMRRRYPDSGPKIAFSEGGPLFRFVNAVLVGYGRSPVTDAGIKGAFTQWAKIRNGCPELSDLD